MYRRVCLIFYFAKLQLLLPVIVLSSLFYSPVKAQKRALIEILNANTFEGDESLGKNVSRLVGDVRFKHKSTIMKCDSAYLYQNTNSLDAFGKINITKGDSIRLTGDFLKYDGNTSVAVVTGNVKLADRKMTLTSNNLTYDMDNETGFYTDGGTILDHDNKLTSHFGLYNSKSNMVFFKSNVKLNNPSYHLNSDTLAYNTNSTVAFFYGPTRIFSHDKDTSYIYCENGWYNTKSGKSYFGKKSFVKSGSKTIVADSLLYDNNELIGRGFGHVQLTDTTEKIEITGDYGFVNDISKIGMVTGSAVLSRVFTSDTLFVKADTLYAAEDTLSKLKKWKAYHHVMFFKSDLQGKCDSIAFDEIDSLMHLYTDPVIWSSENQLTADSIRFLIYDDNIQELHMRNNSFICSSEGDDRYSQVKGRNMKGYFINNDLRTIYVSGNGQSVYYTKNSEDELTGVNRADCSDMVIEIDDNAIREIKLITLPDATLYPLNELSGKELILRGFHWRIDERPTSKSDF
jgi:lipopolysaccharide export system protein LptA